MYSSKLEKIMEMAVADGIVTEKERKVIYSIAEAEGVSCDEIDVVLDAMLFEKQNNSGGSAHISSSDSVLPPLPEDDRKRAVCPHCGGILDPTLAYCPECHVPIRNTKAASSVQTLVDKLEGIGSDNVFTSFLGYPNAKKKAELIKNFPVPTNKEDIIEFLIISLPFAKRKFGFFKSADEEEGDRIICKAWKLKFEQILVKARIALAEDADALRQVGKIETEYKTKK